MNKKYLKKILFLFISLVFVISGIKFFLELNKKRKQKKLNIREHQSIKISQFKNRRIRQNHHSWQNFLRENKTAAVILCLAVMSIFGSKFFEKYYYFFRASLLPVEFTGTINPVEKVPNWAALSDAERNMHYSQIPQSKLIKIPDYDLTAFQKGMQWNGSNDNDRNSYITYSVPYLGNYTLDGTENSGSHPGIDIKLPIGTPIRSIANGFVDKKVSESQDNTGAGNHLVIKHPGMPNPDPNDSRNTITVYSVYEHLSKFADNISVGMKVDKGQVIAFSGNSGRVTTPHLHFQIDHEDAPFHPYWPFSWKEAQNAGYDFYTGIKNGLGQNNAKKYTIHPVNLIAKHQNYMPGNLVASTDDKIIANLNTSVPDIEPEINESEEKIEDKQDEQKNDTKEDAPKQEVDKKEEEKKENKIVEKKPVKSTPEPKTIVKTTPKINTTSKKEETFVGSSDKPEFEKVEGFIPGEELIIKIYAEQVASSGIELGTTLKHYAEITPSKLMPDDFNYNVAKVGVKTTSDRIFKLVAKGDFGEVKSNSLRPMIFLDVNMNNKFYDAIKYLKENQIVNGYPDGTYRPAGTLNRAESVKIMCIANQIPVEFYPTDFDDVSEDEWFADYVGTAVENGIVEGYDDGTFRPGNTITRAEFLKVAILTANFDPGFPDHDPYDDVNKDEWFSPYVSFAKEHNLITAKRGGYMTPHAPITRGEAAEVIFKLSQIGR